MLIMKHIHNNFHTNFTRSSGFSLVELMLAMLIGLIIMGGVMQIYLSTRDTQRTNEDQLQLLADGRFAIDTIAYDLRHAGIWGGTNETKAIACKLNTEYPCEDAGIPYVMPAATDDCTGYEYNNLDVPIIAFDANNPFDASCATESYKANTDVLSLRYADSSWVTEAPAPGLLAADVVYVRSNFVAGQMFVGQNVPDTDFYKWDDLNVTHSHPMISRVYYVSDYTDTVGDGLPSLHRVDLSAGPVMTDKVLLQGVEDFQLEFGIDTSTPKDFQVNSYVSAASITPEDWSNGRVLAAKIWVLMVSERVDRNNIGSAQSFTIAGNPVVTDNDGRRRYLMSSIVRLRNTARLDLKQVGGG